MPPLGDYIASAGNVSLDTLKKYVEFQREKEEIEE